MASLSIPNPALNLSSLRALKATSLQIHLPFLKTPTVDRPQTVTIRMGGGPRTYPGGVSKWQWKRMQAKKAKQLQKARLCRERQIYEMRKRAELQAAVSELERPWEVVDKAPNLFSVKADEQLKVLADRFQKPGGYDLWTEEDGPQLFRSPADGLPSARFFPKGAVHSVKPYGRITENSGSESELSSIERERRGGRRSRQGSNWRSEDGSSGENVKRTAVSLARRSNEHTAGNSEEMRMSRTSNANGRVGSSMNGRSGLDDGRRGRASLVRRSNEPTEGNSEEMRMTRASNAIGRVGGVMNGRLDDHRRSGASLVRRSNELSEGNSAETRMSRASNANGRVGGAMNGKGLDDLRSGASLVRRSYELTEGNLEETRVSRASNANSRAGSSMNGRGDLDDHPHQRRVRVGRNTNDPRNDGSHRGRELDDYLYALEPEWASIDKEMNRKIGYTNSDGYKASNQSLAMGKSEDLYGSDSDGFYGSESELGSIEKEDSGNFSFTRKDRNFGRSYQLDEGSSDED
ncbi:hypothetical protein ACLOJK_016881 [Asimina triloba]